MKIGKKLQPPLSKHYIWLLVSLFLFGLGFVWGRGGIAALSQSNPAESLWRAWTSTYANGADLPQLVIDMPFENYDRLQKQQEEGEQAGVFIGSEDDFLNGDVRFNGETIPIRLRLNQGIVDSAEDGGKWAFEVHTRRDRQLLGLSHFFLVDPAARGWLDEWAFMAALRREDMLAVRYRFVQLVFNGEDRGIYALQEGFASELLADQARSEGVIVAFDTTRLWESVRHMGGETAAEADPITRLTADSYRPFTVDVLWNAAISKNEDEMVRKQRNEAIELLQGLQDGSLAADDVFQVERLGMFLALADLWGAAEGTHLTNLRFYYNPAIKKLEPIGFNGSPKLYDDGERISLETTYGDAQIQAAYVAAAQQVTQPDYLAQLQADLEAEWQLQAAQIGEAAELTPPWEGLKQRQRLLQRSLNPAEPVVAHLGSQSLSMEGIVQVDVASVVNLPVELVGFTIDGGAFLPAERDWWQNRPDTSHTGGMVLPRITGPVDGAEADLQFARFWIPLTAIIAADGEIDFNQEITVGVVTRLVGGEETILTEAQSGR